jgi:hypothetical protein
VLIGVINKVLFQNREYFGEQLGLNVIDLASIKLRLYGFIGRLFIRFVGTFLFILHLLVLALELCLKYGCEVGVK